MMIMFLLSALFGYLIHWFVLRSPLSPRQWRSPRYGYIPAAILLILLVSIFAIVSILVYMPLVLPAEQPTRIEDLLFQLEDLLFHARTTQATLGAIFGVIFYSWLEYLRLPATYRAPFLRRVHLGWAAVLGILFVLGAFFPSVEGVLLRAESLPTPWGSLVLRPPEHDSKPQRLSSPLEGIGTGGQVSTLWYVKSLAQMDASIRRDIAYLSTLSAISDDDVRSEVDKYASRLNAFIRDTHALRRLSQCARGAIEQTLHADMFELTFQKLAYAYWNIFNRNSKDEKGVSPERRGPLRTELKDAHHNVKSSFLDTQEVCPKDSPDSKNLATTLRALTDDDLIEEHPYNAIILAYLLRIGGNREGAIVVLDKWIDEFDRRYDQTTVVYAEQHQYESAKIVSLVNRMRANNMLMILLSELNDLQGEYLNALDRFLSTLDEIINMIVVMDPDGWQANGPCAYLRYKNPTISRLVFVRQYTKNSFAFEAAKARLYEDKAMSYASENADLAVECFKDVVDEMRPAEYYRAMFLSTFGEAKISYAVRDVEEGVRSREDALSDVKEARLAFVEGLRLLKEEQRRAVSEFDRWGLPRKLVEKRHPSVELFEFIRDDLRHANAILGD